MSVSTPLLAALVARKADVVGVFRRAGATSRATAIPVTAVPQSARAQLERCRADGTVRALNDGRLYLDEDALLRRRAERHFSPAVLLTVMALVVGCLVGVVLLLTI